MSHPSRIRQLASHLANTTTTTTTTVTKGSAAAAATMSTTTSTANPPLAPWRSLFLEHLSTMSTPEFTLATIRLVSSSSSSSPPPSGEPQLQQQQQQQQQRAGRVVTPYPRARTCVFRGLLADLPVNPKNDARLNPRGVYTSDLPTFTTDARMDKMDELFGRVVAAAPAATDEGPASTTAATYGQEKQPTITTTSGGGAPVEATFWVAGPMVQWRVRGRAYVLAADDVEDGGSGGGSGGVVSEEGRKTTALLRSRMSTFTSSSSSDRSNNNNNNNSEGGGEGEEGWSFRREIAAHFSNLSPGMRGSFRNPPPGRPAALPVPSPSVPDEKEQQQQQEEKEGGCESPPLRLGQKVTSGLLDDDVARAHFRLVVVVPDEVDRTDLSDPARGRRWIYRYLGGGNKKEPAMPGGEVVDGWEKVEVWP